jgi:hypothetical protein
MGSISPFGSKNTASPEPSTHPQSTDIVLPSPVDVVETTPNSTLRPETRPSQRQKDTLEQTTDSRKARVETLSPAADPQATLQEAPTGDNAGIHISRVVLTKTSKYNPTIHNRLLRSAKLDSQRKHDALHISKSVASERNGQTTKQPEEDTDKAELKAMQQQLQHLTKQVRLLEGALEEKKTKEVPGPQSATPPMAAKIEEDKLQVLDRQESIRAQPSSAIATTKPTLPVTRHKLHTKPEASDVLDRAKYRYRRSTSELVNAANELDESRPALGASIVAMIQKRLTVIGRDAILENDPKTIERLRPYKKLRYLGIAMKDSKDVSLAKKTYRRSAIALVGIVKSLEEMTSQAASHIAVMIRDRLTVMIQEAATEHDVKMRQALLSTKMFRWHDPAFGDLATLTMVPLIRKVPLETYDNGNTPSKLIAPPKKHAEKESVLFQATPDIITQKRIDEVVASQSTPVSELTTDRATPVKKPGVETDERKGQEEDTGHRTPPHTRTQSRSTRLPGSTLDSTPEPMQERQNTYASTKSPVRKPAQAPKESPVNIDPAPRQPAPTQSDEVGDHSLFEELFPEATVSPPVRPAENREHYPKLNLPEPSNLIRPKATNQPRNPRDQVIESFVKRGEDITALQLEHCSTELTEFDFRRLITKGKHIEAWNSDGAFYKVIPGRDPISLERLPFYYLLFRSPEAAHAYQKNASRLHKLAALHQPSNIFSAIPPPRGFLEDGEDIEAITSSYVLKPTEHSFSLRTVMQPYHPALRALFKQGGYTPIVPNTDSKRNRVHKVLMHIEGYEPSPSDLFKILRQDAWQKSMLLTLRNESSSSIHRLRDVINLKTHLLPLATTNPRAYDHTERSGNPGNQRLEFDDPNIAHFMKSDAENPQEINQIVMNRVYNRWILEFDDEDEARRFAIAWHRRPLPNLGSSERTWKDYEEARMCNCELLW